ncbi:hypothetical protein OROHE_010067 [Orobanche hederae]
MHAGFSDSLEPHDVNPRLVFHYGIPLGSMLFAYDSIQQILAISTKDGDGQIKLFGKDGGQALLESSEMVAGKFLLIIENQGVLLHVNVKNHIEVWDLDRKCLSSIHRFEKEITSFAAMRNGLYLYVGDSAGDISVLRLHQSIEKMNYHIPLSASHGKVNEVGVDVAAKFVLPQPTAETKRILIMYSDGIIALWAIRESKVISATTLHCMEAKKITAACWACPAGTKVFVGYSNGDIILWSVPSASDSKTEQASQKGTCAGQITPIYKLNLGYKADRVPIAKLKWVDADGKLSRLFVLGGSECRPADLLQVVLLNEYTETRTIKVGLHLPESLVDLEITTSTIEQNKGRCGSLLLLGRSTSHLYIYDDSLIERYLLQCQTKSAPSLPREVKIKLPYGDSSITVTKFITELPCMPGSAAEDINMLAKNSSPFFPFAKRVKDGSASFSPLFSARNLLITGHSSGAINLWDASCPLLLPVAFITQQSDSDVSLSGVPLTALHFNYNLQTLVSGDQSGMVRIYTLKSELFVPQSTFVPFQEGMIHQHITIHTPPTPALQDCTVCFTGNSKKGSNHIIRRIKAVKVNGAVQYISTTDNLKQLAVGSDQGYVSLIDPEGPNVLYQKHIASEFCTGVISMHFQTCRFHGFDKNVIIVATKDSSIITLERDTGNMLSSSVVRPNKPSVALFTRILDGHGTSSRISSLPDGMVINDTSSDNWTPKESFVLLCSEKAVYAYSLSQLIQGIKKVLHKKKFSSSCCWASTFGSPADIGLILLFATGKIEIRSLPELSLVKESSIRALMFSTLRPMTVSSAHNGDIIIINGDQELLFVSTLVHKEPYRHVESISKVLDRELASTQGLISSSAVKEKKKGIFGSMVKDNKGPNATNGIEPENQASRQSAEQLSILFSTVNFPTNTETEERFINEDLDIDDIEIEDPKDKARRYPMIVGFGRHNITNKFPSIKSKLKKAKTDKVPEMGEPVDEKTGDVDQIKKRYGYASSGDSGVAVIAKTKLSENMKMLQGIGMKTTEMQETGSSS